jgi:hypothetical protein
VKPNQAQLSRHLSSTAKSQSEPESQVNSTFFSLLNDY